MLCFLHRNYNFSTQGELSTISHVFTLNPRVQEKSRSEDNSCVSENLRIRVRVQTATHRAHAEAAVYPIVRIYSSHSLFPTTCLGCGLNFYRHYKHVSLLHHTLRLPAREGPQGHCSIHEETRSHRVDYLNLPARTSREDLPHRS